MKYYFLKWSAPVLFFLLFLSACGYHIAGRGSHLPPEIRTIAIPVFHNKTLEPLIEEELTSGVVRKFQEDSRIRVVNREDAHVILLGSVVSFKEIPLSFDEAQNVLEYRIEVTTHFELFRNEMPLSQPDHLLWKRDITVSTEYIVTGDVMFTRTAKLQAFKELSRNLSDEVVDRVMWGW